MKTFVLVFTLAFTGTAFAAEPIKIGDMNSLTGEPEYAAAYYEGANLAVEQINGAGGVLGRPLEILKRDDKADPANATRLANELLDRDHVAFLAGTWIDDVNLAVSNVARARHVLYLKTGDGTDKYIWGEGHKYGFRIFPTNRVIAAILAEEAAKLPITKWAVIAPNYEYGHDLSKNFQIELKARRPDVHFVAEQFPELFKTKGDLTIRAVARSGAQGVFNVMFGPDMVNIIRAGNKIGYFKGKAVIAPALGMPEYYPSYGAEYPSGWIVTGYAPEAVDTAPHKAFTAAFHKKYGMNAPIKFGTLSGYITYQIAARMIAKAGTLDTEALIKALHTTHFQTAAGDLYFRAIDNQSNAGEWVGKTALVNGKPTFVDFHYPDGARYMPSDDWIKTQRKSTP